MEREQLKQARPHPGERMFETVMTTCAARGHAARYLTEGLQGDGDRAELRSYRRRSR